MTSSTTPGIPIVYVDSATGEKGLFSSSAQLAACAGVVNAEDLAENLAALCERLSAAFRRVHDAAGAFEMESVEVTLDLTAKGQVRLVASVSSEVKGGMKVVFKRRTSHQRP